MKGPLRAEAKVTGLPLSLVQPIFKMASVLGEDWVRVGTPGLLPIALLEGPRCLRRCMVDEMFLVLSVRTA